MLKGINKRVIIIKNPDSEIFEEAYFIIKTGKGFFKQAKENEMVAEANRIISDYSRQQKSMIDKEKSEKSDKSERKEKPEKTGSIDNVENAGNINAISSATAEIDKFLNDKMQNSGKAEKQNNDNNNDNDSKTGKSNANKSYSMQHLTDDEIFEDEKFFENIKNSKNNFNDFNCRNSYDSCANDFDCPPEANSNIPADPFREPKFKLISSKKIKRFTLPPKSFFAGIAFMSAVVIAIRILEFVFSK
ncbi:MAG: hypothetical protein FWD71_14485 [Oscillospiraceae bacterium]|nr:hypothetical protein [Oscillospiraceae bacterium]